MCVGHDLCGRRLTSSVRIAQSLDPAISPRFRHPACRKISESRDANCAKGMVNENYLDFAMILMIALDHAEILTHVCLPHRMDRFLAQKQNGYRFVQIPQHPIHLAPFVLRDNDYKFQVIPLQHKPQTQPSWQRNHVVPFLCRRFFLDTPQPHSNIRATFAISPFDPSGFISCSNKS